MTDHISTVLTILSILVTSGSVVIASWRPSGTSLRPHRRLETIQGVSAQLDGEAKQHLTMAAEELSLRLKAQTQISGYGVPLLFASFLILLSVMPLWLYGELSQEISPAMFAALILYGSGIFLFLLALWRMHQMCKTVNETRAPHVVMRGEELFLRGEAAPLKAEQGEALLHPQTVAQSRGIGFLLLGWSGRKH